MSTTPAHSSARTGVLLAIAAYTMWGVAPLYFKQLQAIPSMDILLHRIVWSVAVLLGLITLLRQWPKVMAAFASRKVMTTLLMAGFLLAGNWLLFIWAINNDHLLDASLGYYINPLLNILFGRLVLGERLRRFQQLAVGLAFSGVAILVISFGQVPWIALTLALSFSVYGLLRKRVAVDSMPGLLIETLLLMPAAVIYWVWFASDASNMLSNSASLNLWLIAAGIVTTVPLLCFTGAARRIMYSTLGFFQYIGPTIMFVLAVWLYHEPLAMERLLTFGFVWTALVIFSLDSLHHYRQQRRLSKSQAAA